MRFLEDAPTAFPFSPSHGAVALLCVLGAVGCNRAAKQPAPTSSASAQPPGGTAAESFPPAATSACDRLLHHEQLGIDSEKDDMDQPDVTLPRFACDRTSGWAARWDPDTDAAAYSGAFTLLRESSSAGVVRWSVFADGSRPLWPASLDAYDFDHDGEPELIAALRTHAGARDPVFALGFVTFKSGRVEPYAPAIGMPIDRLEDIDHDGRPDLVLEYVVGRGHRCDWAVDGGGGPDIVTLVAHTLADGSFSLSDGVAQTQFAERYGCTRAPSGTVHVSDGGSGADAPSIVEASIVCARLWGVAADAVMGELDRVCAPYASQTRACRGPCRYVEDARQFARFEPPVTFGK
jgi:hypothetical protein